MNIQTKNYDVIIIGAGIGGLVCGCYLAKAGMKVLIAEQHYKPGGYCTSFNRKGFTFDAAAHSFGGCRKGGVMRLILNELGLNRKIRIIRTIPSDTIITPDFKINFLGDIDKIINELQKAFPNESNNINNFIHYLINTNPIEYVSLRRITYNNLLDNYFNDYRLKSILSLPVLGNGALPPSLISAFTGSKIFTEFILDGGYYPEDNMQSLSNALAERFTELGGNLLLSSLAQKIKVRNNHVEGVRLKHQGFVKSQYVISNCDARQTFLKLIGKKILNNDLLEKVNTLTPSLSSFIVYLGIKKPFKSLPKPGTNIWFLPYYDLEKAYLLVKKGNIDRVQGYMVRISPDRKTILAFINAPFRNKRFWDNNKARLLESFINKIDQSVIHGLKKYIAFKDAATPYTLYNYTLNYKGAAYGWASFPSQLFTPELRQKTPINGLYLTGHWTTQTQGIPGVAYLGMQTAKLIQRKVLRN